MNDESDVSYCVQYYRYGPGYSAELVTWEADDIEEAEEMIVNLLTDPGDYHRPGDSGIWLFKMIVMDVSDSVREKAEKIKEERLEARRRWLEEKEVEKRNKELRLLEELKKKYETE